MVMRVRRVGPDVKVRMFPPLYGETDFTLLPITRYFRLLG